MKIIILCILVVITFQSATGQSQIPIINFIDTTFTIKEINTYEDTLWVMDSSHFYRSINHELQFSGKYNVLTRDEVGNKLTGLGKSLTNWGEVVNSYLDSVTYFNGTSNIHHIVTSSWNYTYSSWVNNNYELYDDNLYLTEQYSKGWNMYQDQYLNGRRTTYNFDNGLRTSIIIYNYLPESNEWEPNEKQVNYYNETGKDSVQLKQKWNIYNNQWENISIDKAFYNVHEKDSLRLELRWNIETELWVNQIKNETFYIDSLNSIDFYRSNWDGVLNSWVNDVHIQSYDTEDEQMDSTTHYRWDITTDEWVFDRKAIVLYNETGKILEYISMLFDNQNSRWMNNMKLTYLYNDNNVERISYNGDSISCDWIPYYRAFHSFIYDNVTDTTQYDIWDTMSQQWVFTSRFIKVFDQRLNQTNSISEMWNNSDDTWQIMQQTDHSWSSFHPLGVVENVILNDYVEIYPNPASSVLNINVLLENIPLNLIVEIFDINGRSVLKSKQESSFKQFDIKYLGKGLYIVIIQNGSSFVTKRIIIQ